MTSKHGTRILEVPRNKKVCFMKNRLGLFISIPLFLSVSQNALAAATAEEATRLTGVFQSYLGTEPGVITIAPAGDDYNVTLNFEILAAKAAKDGATLKISPISFILTPKDTGKWNVSVKGPMSFSLSAMPQMAMDMKAESYNWQGEFDEALQYFTTSSGDMSNLAVTEKIDDPAQGKTDVAVTVKSIKLSQTGAANADGAGVDTNLNYEFEGLSETIANSGSASSPVPPMNIVITAASGKYESKAVALHTKSLFDILAFFIAHPSKELIVKDQAILKTTLMSAIPLFENLQGDASLKTVSITTPMGPVGMDELSFSADINGVVKEGQFGESISFSGLTVPAAVVPAWATTLVPKDMTFDFAVSDFDLASPANLVLAALDFASANGLPDGFEATLLPALLPKGSANITLNPTSISNDLYEINAEGALTVGPATMPSGKAKISATGIDEILKVIQAAPPEAGVQGGVAMIVAAKGMSKPGEGGALTWDVESTADGKVLINGLDPMKMQ